MKPHLGETIGLLGGTGKLGLGLALRWGENHKILIGSRVRERALQAAQTVRRTWEARGLRAYIDGAPNDQIVRHSDVIVFCLKYEPAIEIANRIKDLVSDQIIVSPVVAMRREGMFFVPSLTPPDSAAIRLREILPKTAKVVSALHNVPAERLRAEGPMPDYAVIVYGEDPAKEVIMKLIGEMKSLNPLDGGPLELSYLSEQLTPLLLNVAKLNRKRDLSVKFF